VFEFHTKAFCQLVSCYRESKPDDHELNSLIATSPSRRCEGVDTPVSGTTHSYGCLLVPRCRTPPGQAADFSAAVGNNGRSEERPLTPATLWQTASPPRWLRAFPLNFLPIMHSTVGSERAGAAVVINQCNCRRLSTTSGCVVHGLISLSALRSCQRVTNNDRSTRGRFDCATANAVDW